MRVGPIVRAFFVVALVSSCDFARGIDPAKLEWSVGQLIAELERGDPRSRTEAATLLMIKGPDAKEAVPALVRSLKHDDPYVRQFSVAALGKISAGEPEIVDAVRPLLRDGVWHVQSEAARTLGGFGKKSGAAADELRALLKSPYGYVRTAAAAALWSIAPSADEVVPPLIATLADSDRLVAAGAVDVLGRIGPAAAPARPELLRLIRRADGTTLRSTAEALGRIGGPAEEIVPPLLPLLDGDDRNERTAAAVALVAVAPTDARVVAKLDAIFADDEVGWTVAAALGDAGVRSLAELRKQIRSSDPITRRNGAVGIIHIGPAASDAMDDLLAAVSDGPEGTRKYVVEAVGAVGTDDPVRIKKLVDAATREFNSSVLEPYAEALAGCGPGVVAPLAEALGRKNTDDDQRRQFIKALKLLGPDAKPAAATVARLVDTSNSTAVYNSPILDEVLDCLQAMGPDAPGLAELAGAVVVDRSQSALRVLPRLGKRAKPALPNLLVLLKEHPRYHESAEALGVLANIGEATPEVIAAVEGAVEHHPLAAKAALWRLGRRDPKLLAEILNAAESTDPERIDGWIEVIRSLGADAKEAAPRLEARLDQPGYVLRKLECAEALAAIAPDRMPEILKRITAYGGDAFDQADVLRTLATFGPAAAGAADFAATRLTAQDESLRTQAAVTLSIIAPGRFAEAKPVLERALQGVDPSYPRVLAARGAAEIGEPARALLEKASQSPDAEARIIARRALRTLDTKRK